MGRETLRARRPPSRKYKHRYGEATVDQCLGERPLRVSVLLSRGAMSLRIVAGPGRLQEAASHAGTEWQAVLPELTDGVMT